ncbi:MAG TPA: cyclic peptide export ABC transporter [Bacillota bacterium]|nr:cyclic peptide export ABC transporter [Bacillota bacterium]
MDNLSLTIVCILGLFTLATLYFLAVAIIELVKGERKFSGNGFKGFIGFIFSLVVLAGIAYCVYRIPRVFFGGVSWLFIEEWGPVSLIAAVLSLAVSVPVFFFYFLFTKYFVKPNEKPFFPAIVLSIVSGLGNSLLIMVINDALNRNLSYSNRWVGIGSGLYLYFILGILLFTVSAMVVRKQLIALTNNLVCDKRIEIIQKILKAPYDKLQAVEEGKIQAVLNNDTEVISGFINTLVNGLTGLITMASCLIYLGTINVYGLLASVAIIGLAVGLFLSVSQTAEKFWEKSRDIQNIFFKFITDLVGGFKELYINPRKRNEFQGDMQQSCVDYRDTRMGGEYKFIGVSITGEMLFIAVIGVVVFTFSIIFPNIQGNTLRTYVLVYLYMGGIVNQEVYLIPGFIRVLISWRRINELIQELTLLQPEKEISSGPEPQGKQLTLELQNVSYQYKSENGGQFAVGPIRYRFCSGEICFITGGNGSGKSTLAKLITGIYRPDEGEILLNGQRLDSEALGTYFSTVFSDFYLFDKLYGIDYEVKREAIQQYLKVLRIDDKVEVSEGSLSTIKLSTGQRKRIALLISYLEDHQIFLFDEWAADQDPEFRKYFYQSLLPELKSRGKMVIAITHDDRYYNLADRVLKMELGQIVDSSQDVTLNKAEVASATIS